MKMHLSGEIYTIDVFYFCTSMRKFSLKMFLDILASLNMWFQDIMDNLRSVTKLPELFFFRVSIYAFVLINFAFDISKLMVSFILQTILMS